MRLRQPTRPIGDGAEDSGEPGDCAGEVPGIEERCRARPKGDGPTRVHGRGQTHAGDQPPTSGPTSEGGARELETSD
jgi:hypothetical protein